MISPAIVPYESHADVRRMQVLKVLTHNAVQEKRFDDAGFVVRSSCYFHLTLCWLRFYYWQLSLGALQLLQKQSSENPEEDPDPVLVRAFHETQRKASYIVRLDVLGIQICLG